MNMMKKYEGRERKSLKGDTESGKKGRKVEEVEEEGYSRWFQPVRPSY